MAKAKTKSYIITDGHILHGIGNDVKEYFTGDTIDLTDEQAALLGNTVTDKAEVELLAADKVAVDKAEADLVLAAEKEASDKYKTT